jgi:hypothetical protein
MKEKSLGQCKWSGRNGRCRCRCKGEERIFCARHSKAVSLRCYSDQEIEHFNEAAEKSKI